MTYNVVRDYDWTSVPRGSGYRNDAPRVMVTSYKLKSNQILQTISNYINIAQQAGKEGSGKTFYENMYADATEKEDNFNFPFFNDNIRSMTNTFGDTFQSGVGGSGGIGGAFTGVVNNAIGKMGELSNIGELTTAKTAYDQAKNGQYDEAKKTMMNGGNPGTYIETPMFYQFEKSDAPLEVSFSLSNTITSDYDRNYDLVQLLTKINRPDRKNSIVVDPPRIYQVKVPGHRFIKWAYCSSFSVSFIGTRRIIGEKIVPEGYHINLAFTSLTLEHAGFGLMT